MLKYISLLVALIQTSMRTGLSLQIYLDYKYISKAHYLEIVKDRIFILYNLEVSTFLLYIKKFSSTCNKILVS